MHTGYVAGLPSRAGRGSIPPRRSKQQAQESWGTRVRFPERLLSIFGRLTLQGENVAIKAVRAAGIALNKAMRKVHQTMSQWLDWIGGGLQTHLKQVRFLSATPNNSRILKSG